MNLKIWDVIKYEGNNNTLVWKHEAEDFNTNSKLIVKEPMEAIFFSNGKVADVFKAGEHVLNTGNIPVLRRILEIPTGGVSPFHCQVYFVNKVEIMALRWGTDSKVQFIEPTYNFPMEIGARGSLSLRISDSAAFVTRLIGAENSIMPETITRYFRSFIQNRVKSQLARTIKEQQLNIFEIDTQLDILSDVLRDRLRNDFATYGVELVQFLIDEVVRPEDDYNYIRLKDLAAKRYTDIFEAQTQSQVEIIRGQTEAQKRVIEAQSIAKKRELENYTYQEERGFNVAEKVADNDSVGQFSNLGVGLGVMAGVSGVMGSTMAGVVGGAMQSAAGQPYNPQPFGAAPYGAQPMGQPYGVQPAAGQPYGAQPAAGQVYGAQPVAAQSYTTQPVVETAATAQPVQESEAPAEVSPVQQETSQAGATKVCQCGAVIGIKAKFCPECGAKQPKLCPGCGKVVSDTAKFCDECGTRLM